MKPRRLSRMRSGIALRSRVLRLLPVLVSVGAFFQRMAAGRPGGRQVMERIPYRIYQLPFGHPARLRGLPPGECTDLGKFDLVYEGVLERQRDRTDIYDVEKMLEDLYDRFNVGKPPDFSGRSLSVGDVVRVGGSVFSCECGGWRWLMTVPEGCWLL